LFSNTITDKIILLANFVSLTNFDQLSLNPRPYISERKLEVPFISVPTLFEKLLFSAFISALDFTLIVI